MAKTVGDFFIERLHQWGVRRIYGYPGDGINGALARCSAPKARSSLCPGPRQPCRTVWGKFAVDSPQEGDGFELSVPRQKDNVFEAPQLDSAIPGEAIAHQMATA